MKRFSQALSVAIGISTLCVLPLLAPFLSPDHVLVYHLSHPAPPLFASAVFYWGLACLLVVGLLWLAGKFGSFGKLFWLGIMLFLPGLVVANCDFLGIWDVPRWLTRLVLFLPAAFFAGLFSFRRESIRPVFDGFQDFTKTILSFIGIASFFILLQLCWLAWQARDLNPVFHASRSAASPVRVPARVKVVWILMDELSYKQVYEQRFPGIELPAFDKLAAQSTLFTDVLPAGVYTENVIPSLFTGQPVDGLRLSSDGRLLALHNPVSEAWPSFDPRDTVFEDAHAAGYLNGVAGWYNPYCRILPQVLDRCFWTYRASMMELMRGDRISPPGISSNLRLGASYLLLTPLFPQWHRNLHIKDFTDIRDAGDAILRDPSIDFVFLHVPVPHPEGIYDRRQMSFATHRTSYIDNLVLADRYLAHVRQLLEQQGQWDSSAVIVMGDHSWRTNFMWEITRVWSAEDEVASHGGQFDSRPAYIVKMPMQENAARVDTSFKAMDTRALLDAILTGQARTAEGLKEWAGQQR